MARDEAGKNPAGRADPLSVASVEKAFRVLTAFDEAHPALSLTQLAALIGLDRSAVQRFTYTLERLGYLRKDPTTKHFELTVRTLELGHHYSRANTLIERAMPYLQHLSRTTEETINLTVRDDVDIVFVSRFMSRHVLNTDVVIGTRMPAFCTAPGLAMLSALPRDEATDILRRSDRRAFTPATNTDLDRLLAELSSSASQGYAMALDQFYQGDLSIASAVLDRKGRPVGAINIAVSRARFTPEQAETEFSSLIVAAALSVSSGKRAL
ncbi:IclR family transcriptional regulator [Lichenibacterium ramalinae]|uniref:IclR family transcriptional regulator n=1 Tax=Lichenibacterium ramalinae TaxID=2316527 RepID=A0A4Q2R7S4_9HYPH|nr:IclR family transcriptional regulator C-terminal domain-containing protein [Lichenibacterium ramalinae]RYB01470.1 IclR family transcriptional regulator [Lichenibacterium ramalinae]